MTLQQREQQARECIHQMKQALPCLDSVKTDDLLPHFVTLLADTRRAALEEVAGETRRFTSAGAVAQWCRQQAKERS